MWEICSKLTIKTAERRCSDAFILNFEDISHHFPVFIADVSIGEVNVCRVWIWLASTVKGLAAGHQNHRPISQGCWSSGGDI